VSEQPPVFVLEDDGAVAMSIGRALQAARIVNPVEFFDDGERVWARLVEGDEHRSVAPVLVFLDVHVPGYSGLEVLERIRTRPRLAEIPVVMLSASGDEDDIDRSYELGATAYLIKPAGIHGLRDMLSELELQMLLLPRVS
jgi:two-component system response regulator